MVFLYDGDRVQPEHTPEQLGMEDMDEIAAAEARKLTKMEKNGNPRAPEEEAGIWKRTNLALLGLKERPDLEGRRVDLLERSTCIDPLLQRELVRVVGTGERLTVRQRNLRPVRCECESCMEQYPLSAVHAAALRFGVGDRVLANFEGEWKRAMIVSLVYRECWFEDDVVAPYQVQLDESGDFGYADVDTDAFADAATDAPPLGVQPLQCIVAERAALRAASSRLKTWLAQQPTAHIAARAQQP